MSSVKADLSKFKKFKRNGCGQILYDDFFINPDSKLNATFSSTLILKISWKNIEKCKSLDVLSERVLRKTQIEIWPLLSI